ncbi:MAG TPA: hypothetical protein VGB98_11205 [Pyrinomonadaceae bacterium]|jgi:hypothetical protein
MPKQFTRLSPALLALALLVSAAASARAQVAEPDADARAEATTTVGRDAQAVGAQQQPTPTPQPTPRTPLTGEQKIKRAFRGAFLSPTPYAVAAFNAGITQIGEDRLPHKDGGDEVADWGSRTARVFATGTTYRLFGNGFYPALFKQDPRYERAPNKGIGRRAAHAVSRLFVTRGDNGKHQPNFSRFAGAATSSALANVWERSTPGHDRIGADATLKRFGRSFLSGAIGNLVREFLPDIFRR